MWLSNNNDLNKTIRVHSNVYHILIIYSAKLRYKHVDSYTVTANTKTTHKFLKCYNHVVPLLCLPSSPKTIISHPNYIGSYKGIQVRMFPRTGDRFFQPHAVVYKLCSKQEVKREVADHSINFFT